MLFPASPDISSTSFKFSFILGIYICVPSSTTYAKLTFERSASSVFPPAAFIASISLAPSSSSTTPWRIHLSYNMYYYFFFIICNAYFLFYLSICNFTYIITNDKFIIIFTFVIKIYNNYC